VIKGDPRAMNLKGEKFDILALGTFPIVIVNPKTASRSDDDSFLTLKGTVARADRCTHTYVRNISLKGKWISEGATFSEVGVRAVQGVAGSKQLQVGFEGKWQPARDTSGAHILTEVSEEKVVMQINGLTINVGIGRGHHFTNWLDLDVAGLCDLTEEFDLGGLLGYDDHTFASTMPEDCRAHHKEAANASSELRFVSSVSATTAPGGCPL
jgi:hypothetical protein